MQIQFVDPRMVYGVSNKAAYICVYYKLTMRYRAARPRLHAREENTPIQALFAPALQIFLHSTRFCYPVCYPVGPVQQPAANYLLLLDRQKRRSEEMLLSRLPAKRHTSWRLFDRRPFDLCSGWVDWPSRVLAKESIDSIWNFVNTPWLRKRLAVVGSSPTYHRTLKVWRFSKNLGIWVWRYDQNCWVSRNKKPTQIWEH